MNKKEPSWYANIWIGGDYGAAKIACREFCATTPLCVTATETEFIYVNGAESGVLVRLINYPRFPKTADVLLGYALQLAEHLRLRLYQDSYCVETMDKTYWETSREPLASEADKGDE